MALEIVYGSSGNKSYIEQLISSLNRNDVEGTLYIGYPIIYSIESHNAIEALLLSPKIGIVAFILSHHGKSIEQMKEEQDSLFYALQSNLMKNESLRKGRELAIAPIIASFLPVINDVCADKTYNFISDETMANFISEHKGETSTHYPKLVASIQRVTHIRAPKKRENVEKENSKGSILKFIEKEIANLDSWQQKAAIETPDGPQRVRGLAGSGKTIVLALKAAYLHAQHPDWDIVVTFNTRSLKQQFKDIIERFYFEHSGDKPNPNKLKVLNAWGSNSDPGVYSIIANSLQTFPVDFLSAKLQHGSAAPFAGVCSELQSIADSKTIMPLFDAVLIDEAQDLPDSFFKLVYDFTREPKRIVWAYDEMQSLNEMQVSSPDKMFGLNKDGQPRVNIENNDNQPIRDIILPMCYRNTPWALTLAHGYGLGIYRKEGIVQMFDDILTWENIGYKVQSGELAHGKRVSLARDSDTFPEYFERIGKDDAVEIKTFQSDIAQYDWVADQIKQNLVEDELDYDDIIIIIPNSYNVKKNYYELKKSLYEKGVDSNLSGVTTSRNVFLSASSITVSSIYRAKGNEAPMVYIVNSEWCGYSHDMVSRRNTMFTAITRSRAWVRICGVGDEMKELEKELRKVIDKDYQLDFKYPTQDKLNSIKRLSQKSKKLDTKKLNEIKRALNNAAELINEGVLSPDMIEIIELQEQVKSHKKKQELGYEYNNTE